MSNDEVRGGARGNPRDLILTGAKAGAALSDTEDVPVLGLPNIGPTVAARLRQIGVERRSQLEALGALGAYKQMGQAGLLPSLRFDLFGLEAALLGLRLSELSRVRRRELARAALQLPGTTPSIDTRTRGFVPARGRRRR